MRPSAGCTWRRRSAQRGSPLGSRRLASLFGALRRAAVHLVLQASSASTEFEAVNGRRITKPSPRQKPKRIRQTGFEATARPPAAGRLPSSCEHRRGEAGRSRTIAGATILPWLASSTKRDFHRRRKRQRSIDAPHLGQFYPSSCAWSAAAAVSTSTVRLPLAWRPDRIDTPRGGIGVGAGVRITATPLALSQ